MTTQFLATTDYVDTAIAGVEGGGSSPGHVFVYEPLGVTTGSVYTSLHAASQAANAVQGLKWVLYSGSGAQETISSGTFDWTNIVLVGGSYHFTGAAQWERWPHEIRYANISWGGVGATSLCNLITGSSTTLRINLVDTKLFNTGTSNLLRVGSAITSMQLNAWGNSGIFGTGSLSASLTSEFGLHTHDNSTLDETALTGSVGFFNYQNYAGNNNSFRFVGLTKTTKSIVNHISHWNLWVNTNTTGSLTLDPDVMPVFIQVPTNTNGLGIIFPNPTAVRYQRAYIWVKDVDGGMPAKTITLTGSFNNMFEIPGTSNGTNSTYVMSRSYDYRQFHLVNFNSAPATWRMLGTSDPILDTSMIVNKTVALQGSSLISGSSEVAAMNNLYTRLDFENVNAGSFTWALADAGKKKRFTLTCTASLPGTGSVAWVTGTVLYGRQVVSGTALVLITGSNGTVINNTKFRTTQQHSEFVLHYVGSNQWDLSGDLST